jgi:hypothetical protein
MKENSEDAADGAAVDADRCGSRVKEHRCRLPAGHAGFHQSRTDDGKTFSWDSPENRD